MNEAHFCRWRCQNLWSWRGQASVSTKTTRNICVAVMYCPLLNFDIVLIAENDVLNIQDFIHQYFNILYLKGTTLNMYYFNLAKQSMSKGYQTKKKSYPSIPKSREIRLKTFTDPKLVLKRLQIRSSL